MVGARRWSRRLLAHANLGDRAAAVELSRPGETAADAYRRVGGGAAIALLFVDHAKDRYLADLVALEPFLKSGCVVVADNVLCFDGGASLAPYLEHVRGERYASSEMHACAVEYSEGEPDGVEVSVFR